MWAMAMGKFAGTILEMDSIRAKGKETERRYKAEEEEYKRDAQHTEYLGGIAQFEMAREMSEAVGSHRAGIAKSGVRYSGSAATRGGGIAARYEERQKIIGFETMYRKEQLLRQAEEAKRRRKFAKLQTKRDMWGAGLGGGGETGASSYDAMNA